MKLTPSSSARCSTRRALLRIFGLAPDARPCQAHRAEAEAIHVQIAADSDRAGGRRALRVDGVRSSQFSWSYGLRYRC